jgi:hypothetical protein
MSVKITLLLLPVIFTHFLFAQKFTPPAGKQLLIIGQDLESVKRYAASKNYPPPGGYTVYINLFAVNDSTGQYPYGGLGEDVNGNPVGDVDWGAGPVNAHSAAFDPLYRNSVLVIGLYMNEPGKFERVEQGGSDAEIIRLGKFIRTVRKPVYLRIGYEFDGVWNNSYANQEIYKAAFRRVTEELRKQGVKNFATVWQASASPLDDIIEKKHENIEAWYPGDDVVDWMALSWFLDPGYQSPIAEVKTTQGELADEVLALARRHKKPVMIAESAPEGYDLKDLTRKNITGVLDGEAGKNVRQVNAPEIWKAWFQPYFSFIEKNKDIVRAVAYINGNWDIQKMWGPPYTGSYWGNSQVQENKYISDHWKKEIKKKNWLHGSTELFQTLGVAGY